MPSIYLIGGSGDRLSNTEYQLGQLQEKHSHLSGYKSVKERSNTMALEALLLSDPIEKHLALVPLYNVYGKGVKDSISVLQEHSEKFKLLHISRLSVEYILAYRHDGVHLGDMQYVVSHDQAILQTRHIWDRHSINTKLEKVGPNNTTAGLDYILQHPDISASTIAITTPWSWKESDNQELKRIDNFGPKDNHTYFGLFTLAG